MGHKWVLNRILPGSNYPTSNLESFEANRSKILWLFPNKPAACCILIVAQIESLEVVATCSHQHGRVAIRLKK
jgi:hypothetical protein